VAWRRSSSHSLSRFSAITALLTHGGTSKLRQFPALTRRVFKPRVLKSRVLKREGRFIMPLASAVYRSLLNFGIRFGQGDAMLDLRLPSPAALRRTGYRFALTRRFVDR
jgi:hypothetical protein